MDPRVCERIQDQLQRFLDGELAEAAQEEVQAHVEECPACREELQQLAQMIALLDETIAPETGPSGWTFSVLQAVHRHGPLTGWRGRLRGWTRADRLRLCLETALVVLLCWLWMEHPWNPTLSPLELEIVNRPQWLCGSTAAVRVLARHAETREPLRNAWIRLWLSGEPGRHILYTGRTNERGTIDAYFHIPERFQAGNYRLTVEIRSPQGQERLEQPVQLRRDYRLWLTTDRPAYLPGQPIRLRLWAYDRGTQRPAEGQKVSLEALDPRGNRIWQAKERINAYGAVKAECALDRAALAGRYTVRASIAQTATEREVWVGNDRSPQLQVRLSPEQPFYAPGAVMRGQIEARYPWGQAVRQGAVRVAVWPAGAAAVPLSQWRGTTDGRGQATWHLPLPRSLLAGRSAQAVLKLRLGATVQDAQGRTQTVQQSIPISSSPFLLEVIPENGTWVPGVENILYFVARQPDGSPCEVDWEVLPPGRSAGTALPAPAGVAEYHWQPGRSPERLTLIARDRAGRSAALKWSLKKVRPAAHPFLLRTDRAFYKAGDTVHVTVLTPRSGAVYLDALQSNQLILTESLEVQEGRGTLAFDLPPEVSGSLVLQAYSLDPPPAWHDTALLYVIPARQLRVALAADPENDRTRPEASVRLTVTGSDGEPAAAAIGMTLTKEGPAAGPADALLRFPFLFLGSLEAGNGLPDPVARSALLEAVAQAGWPAASPPWRQRWGRALWARQSPPPWDRLPRQNNARAKIERAQQVQRKFLHALRLYGLAVGICGIAALLWRAGRRLSWHLEPWLDRWCLRRPTPPAGLRRRWGWAVAVLSSGLVAGGTLVYGVGKSRSFQPARPSPVQLACWEVPSLPFQPPSPSRAGGAKGLSGAVSQGKRVSREASPAPRGPNLTDPFAEDLAFPETFWMQPALITAEEGQASLQVPLKDPPATWRITAWASSQEGEVGAGETVLQASRDFQLQADLPARLTRLDEIALPVTLFNCREQPQKIRLTVKPLEKPETAVIQEMAEGLLLRSQRLALGWLTDDFIPRPIPQAPAPASPWCTFLEEPARTVTVAPQEAIVVYFRLRADRIGSHALSVSARSATSEEVVKLEVVVQPRGQVRSRAFNGRLTGAVTRTLILPAATGISQVRVKIYPGLLSQLWEDLVALEPPPAANCEQVASALQVRARLLKALQRSPALTPERRAQVERGLHLAYQRLLAFEQVDARGHPTGGFGWSGSGPPQAWLTALALQSLTDLSDCWPADPAVLRRLRRWLRQHQEPEGSWRAEGEPPGSPRHLATTAWVVGALAGDSTAAPALQKARHYLQKQVASTQDPYSLALAVLALRALDRDSPAAQQALQRLVNLRRAEGDKVFWRPSQSTLTRAHGPAADLETTALAVLALQPVETSQEVVERAWTYLLNHRQPSGGWGSSQATGLCLRALLKAFEAHPPATAWGQVTVRVGASEEHKLRLSRRERIAFQEIDLSSQISPGSNSIQLSFRGNGQPLYQIVSAVEQPWTSPSPEPPTLELQVAYRPGRSAAGKPVTCQLRVRNRGPEEAHQVRAEIGLPPGFEAGPAQLQREIPKSVRQFALENQRLVLTWDRLRPGEEQTLQCRFKPSFPLRVQTPPAWILETYTPSHLTYAPPAQVLVD